MLKLLTLKNNYFAYLEHTATLQLNINEGMVWNVCIPSKGVYSKFIIFKFEM